MSVMMNYCLKNCIQSNSTFIKSFRAIHVSQARLLYSQTSLGIDSYLNSRRRYKDQFANYADKLRTKMNDFVLDPKNMIFTEDLKNMTHIAEASDIDLIMRMIKKFNSQSVEFRFGSFIFGPVVMRMFHFLDAPKEALQCFEDPVNKGFFDQQVSYQILLDLLYNNEMFDEMFRVFETVKERQLNMTKYPKYPVVLIMAACYKQNTKKSFEYACNLWTQMNEAGTVPLRRATTTFAALALIHGAPHIALEVLSTQAPHYVTVRNIKVSALADLGRVDDAFPVLRGVLEIDRPDQIDKHTFFEETVLKVKQAVEKTGNQDLHREFQFIENALRDRNLIDNQSIRQLLDSEITAKSPLQESPRTALNKRQAFDLRNRNRNF